jgi:AmmeMemoRadiSam system protein B
MFYPGSAAELRRAVQGFLSPGAPAAEAPKALIAPHAGYVYSGPVAGTAYSLLKNAGAPMRRIVLIGPAHRVAVRGLALPAETAFATPLGEVSLDREGMARTAELATVTVDSAAHALEHSLEVQLPFLQVVLAEFTLIPLLVGEASAEEVAAVLDALWDDPETLVIVSSDLSHYHDYEAATRMDRETSAAIEGLSPEGLGRDSACGRLPIQGLLLVARQRGLRVRCLDRRNSGDTAGPRDRVVGYGAYAVH